MKQLVKVFLILLLTGISHLVSASDRVLDSAGLIKQWGYPAEQHTVKTEDGYILNIFRIPWSPISPKKSKKPVVYLQCPFTTSSDVWLLFGAEKSLAKQLADNGYDVWIGNYRGSIYGRNHVMLSPDDRKFWDFSFHEHGYYDIPAIIDYALNSTGQESLIYVSLSMGTTAFFITLSERPDYNKKVQLFIALGAIAAFYNKPKDDLIFVSVIEFFTKLIDPSGIFEFIPRHPIYQQLWSVCTKLSIEKLCYYPLSIFFGNDFSQFNYRRFSIFFAYTPAGSSGKVPLHYAQLAQYQTFQQYDYGNKEKNIQRYGQAKPPIYNLTNVKVPTLYFYGKNDRVSTINDGREITKRVSSKVIIEAVQYENFNHLDFLIAKDVKKFINNRVIERLGQFVNGEIPEFHLTI